MAAAAGAAFPGDIFPTSSSSPSSQKPLNPFSRRFAHEMSKHFLQHQMAQQQQFSPSNASVVASLSSPPRADPSGGIDTNEKERNAGNSVSQAGFALGSNVTAMESQVSSGPSPSSASMGSSFSSSAYVVGRRAESLGPSVGTSPAQVETRPSLDDTGIVMIPQNKSSSANANSSRFFFPADSIDGEMDYMSPSSRSRRGTDVNAFPYFSSSPLPLSSTSSDAKPHQSSSSPTQSLSEECADGNPTTA
jgi:hypothetical protein